MDAVKIVSQGVEKFKNSDNSLLIITHNAQILKFLKVDFVHVLMGSRIVATGDAGLIDRINESGFQQLASSGIA